MYLLAPPIGMIVGSVSIGGEIINCLRRSLILTYSSKYILISSPLKLVEKFSGSDFKQGSTYVNIERTTELEAEGYSREVTRNIQQARKQAGLKKTDQIKLFIQTSKNMVDNLKQFKSEIKDKVGAFEITISLNQVESKFKFNKEFKIKKESFSISFNLM